MCPLRGLRWKFIRAIIPVDLCSKTNTINQLSAHSILALLSFQETQKNWTAKTSPSRKLSTNRGDGGNAHI